MIATKTFRREPGEWFSWLLLFPQEVLPEQRIDRELDFAQPGLQRSVARWQPLKPAGGQKPVGAHPCLSVVWLGARPRCERGAHHPSGRAGPSGANVDAPSVA